MFLQLLLWYVSESLFWFKHCPGLFCLHQKMQIASILASLPANTFVQVHTAGKVGLNVAYSLHTHNLPQPVCKFKHCVFQFLFPADCQITSFVICISFEKPSDLDFIPPGIFSSSLQHSCFSKFFFHSLTPTQLLLLSFFVGSSFQPWGTALLPELWVYPKIVGSIFPSLAEQCECHHSLLVLGYQYSRQPVQGQDNTSTNFSRLNWSKNISFKATKSRMEHSLFHLPLIVM